MYLLIDLSSNKMQFFQDFISNILNEIHGEDSTYIEKCVGFVSLLLYIVTILQLLQYKSVVLTFLSPNSQLSSEYKFLTDLIIPLILIVFYFLLLDISGRLRKLGSFIIDDFIGLFQRIFSYYPEPGYIKMYSSNRNIVHVLEVEKYLETNEDIRIKEKYLQRNKQITNVLKLKRNLMMIDILLITYFFLNQESFYPIPKIYWAIILIIAVLSGFLSDKLTYMYIPDNNIRSK